MKMMASVGTDFGFLSTHRLESLLLLSMSFEPLKEATDEIKANSGERNQNTPHYRYQNCK